ncbi:triose phosphate isomerase cytosolic isoform [Coemansia reversa NRRL 1564]|uniref:Triosephosphate isomerase n=1 Tax=Coemansia reversa (strain ATCC 12441 / NRRL 1564) TaxID=763665 RepID=A0A2G5BK65_COERN|nr:triose phosphate isomerase cytosolic isoform [Coemansia reversa NRRL 1564]|eukprot:PIA19372.1 triose phosphate isomerase cytosolic isoform [Coemansia reversa NRRL 1564]
MTRTFWVGGNWKMNGTVAAVKELAKTFNAGTTSSDVEVVIGAPYVYIPLLADSLRNDWAVAGENCYVKASGAYTGEISPEMLKDVGAKWVILGHSERRNVLGESDQFTAEKTVKALEAGLKVVLCVGELLEEREAGTTQTVVNRQLDAVIKAVSEADWANIVIAYEPVWAIGTGKVATPDQAQDVHAAIREYLKSAVSPKVAEETRITYGGSVNAKNCKETAQKPDVDGFLVGGASLKPEFLDIVNATN